MKGVYYLNILLLSLNISVNGPIVQADTIYKHTTNIVKVILKNKSLPFEDCGSKYLILYLSISSCTTIPCVMTRGTTVNVHALFDDYSNNTSYLKHRTHWIFNTIKTQAYIAPDPCDGSHKCISNDSNGKFYSATLLVNDSLPAISGIMLWEAVNEYNEDVFCFRVPVVITM